MSKQNITDSIQFESISIAAGLNFVSLTGTFGGTTVKFQYKRSINDSWITLQDGGADKEITETYNENLFLPGGYFRMITDGGSNIDITAEIYRIGL